MESMEDYLARAKSLALNVKYHGVETTEQKISRRVLNGLPPEYALEKQNVALTSRSTTGGGSGMSQICPRFGRGRHKNSSSRELT